MAMNLKHFHKINKKYALIKLMHIFYLAYNYKKVFENNYHLK